MRFVLLAIVLAFPMFDLYVTDALRALDRRPALGMARRRRSSAGCGCCATNGSPFRSNTVAALHGEQSLLRGLVDSGRKVLAGRAVHRCRACCRDVVALIALLCCRSIMGASGRSRLRAERRARRSHRSRAIDAPISGGWTGATSSGRASVGSALPRTSIRPHHHRRRPTTIIGSDSHWPIVKPQRQIAEEVVGLARELADEATACRSPTRKSPDTAPIGPSPARERSTESTNSSRPSSPSW